MSAPTSTSHEILIRIAWDRLMALANTSATSMYRTAFSPTVQAVVDIGFAIVDIQGRLLVVSDVGSTGHMVPIEKVCQTVFSTVPTADMAEGDVYLLNDPWVTSGHLLDVAVVTPIFVGEQVIGAVGSIFHASDVGGLGVSSWATDVFEEGLFIPPTRIVRAGRPEAAIMDLILANVRRPEYFQGDLDAAITGNGLAVAGIKRLLGELGLVDLDWIGSQIIERSELAMREAIRTLTDGTYQGSVLFDPLEPDGPPIEVMATVTVDDGSVVVDYSGSADEVRRGINSTLIYTTGYTQYAVRLSVTDKLPWNAGSLAPVSVIAPPGTIVSCNYPAPTALRHAVGQNIPQLILQALAQASPVYAVADSCGSNVVVSFIPYEGRARDGRVNIASGHGGRNTSDGMNAMTFPARARRQQIEVSEQDGYFRYRRRELRRGSGGAGQFKGGDGMIVELEFTSSGGVLDVNQERTSFPPSGLFGGEGGEASKAFLNGAPLDSRHRGRVLIGDVLRVESAGGGGYGRPTTAT